MLLWNRKDSRQGEKNRWCIYKSRDYEGSKREDGGLIMILVYFFTKVFVP